MSSSPPPDPYKTLGVSKDATLSSIRSAHRKLVLQCHPDKIKDESLKAAKQDEFQKVQQAYEILSDENRRAQYDNQVKLQELRREMGRAGGVGGVGVGGGGAKPYDAWTAEPRPARPYTRPAPKASYEDVPEPRFFETPKPSPTKATVSESKKSRSR